MRSNSTLHQPLIRTIVWRENPPPDHFEQRQRKILHQENGFCLFATHRSPVAISIEDVDIASGLHLSTAYMGLFKSFSSSTCILDHDFADGGIMNHDHDGGDPSRAFNVAADGLKLYFTALERLRIVVYFNVASATILIFDYFLTLPREISLVWSSRWTPTKVLFLLSRYLPFFDVSFLIYAHFRAHNVETCRRIATASSWLFWAGTALCAIILSVRTWAVWNGGLLLGIGLGLLLIVSWIPNIPIILIFTRSLDFYVIKRPSLLGCLVIKGSNIAYICWILLLVNEFGLFFLMLLKAIQCYKNGGMSGLSLLVYRDGLLYYLILFVFAFGNVVITNTIYPDLKGLLVPTERVLHAILTCRIVLDMREYITTSHINTKIAAAVPVNVSSREETEGSE